MSARIWMLGVAMAAVAGVANAGVKATPIAAVEGPETIAYGALRPGAFFAASSGRNILIGGLLGALVDMSDGKNIVEKNEIGDPAEPMARNLAFQLADLRGATVDDRLLALERMKAPQIATAGGSARYVVSTLTTQRSIMWHSLGWNRYRVYYMAGMNVVDTRTQKVALADGCKWNSDKNGAPMPDGAPTRASLLDNKAALLKTVFDEAGQACEAQFSATLSRWAGQAMPRTTLAAVSRVEIPLPPEPVYTPPEPVLAAAPPPPVPVRLVEAKAPTLVVPVQALPSEPVPAPVMMARAEPPRPVPDRYPMFDHRLAAAYAEPTPSPAFVAQSSGVRAAGRDANGYLTWPSKRP